MNPLRTLRDFGRSWRLLKLVASVERHQPGSAGAIEAFLKSASRESVMLHERLSALEKRQTVMYERMVREYAAATRRLEAMLGAAVDRRQLDANTVVSKVAVGLNTVDQHLSELNSLVAAIRDFTTAQQEENRRLRDGYDFTILRNFALRMIVALDEADEKIARARAAGCEARVLDDLQFMRDTFAFAIEGAGLETFRPETGAAFDPADTSIEPQGRVPAPAPEQHMQIAEVLRAGYRIYLNESEVRIVRPAQVRYFHHSPSSN